jgi:ABC-type branched-subunit amino acid transport system substrate-binding protein
MVADLLTRTNRYQFALYPGLAERARLLARYAITQLPGPELTIVYPGNAISAAQLKATITAVRPLVSVNAVPLTADNPAETARALRDAGRDKVLLLGGDDQIKKFVASAASIGWRPLFLWVQAPGGASKGIRAVTVQPTLHSDVTEEARAAYTRYAHSAGFRQRDPSRQFALLALTRLLSAALENTGRDLNRESLVETLAAMHEFRSGVARAGSFNARRHTATSGLYVVPLPESAFPGDPVWLE